VQGGYLVDEPAGPVRVLVKAPGYLMTGAAMSLGVGSQVADFVLVAEPKKRSATLEKDRIDVAARVPFEFRRPRLQSTAGFVLDEVVDVLLHHPELHIAIEAHTDALTNAEEEQTLTDARAQAVLDYLVHHGVEATRLKAIGKGATMPLSKSEPDKNRRIDFVVIKAEK
jgi:outer membrane protein OmpA-like peptidoglycan-associated protein